MSAEVAERVPLDPAQVPEAVRHLLDRLNQSAIYEGSATAAVEIMNGILQAETLDEIFAAGEAGTKSGKDNAGRPFVLTDGCIEWKRSAPGYVQTGGFPFYALARVTFLDNGQEAVLDCGGYTVVSVFESLERRGFLATATEEKGGIAVILEAKQTSSGFSVLIPHLYTGPLWQPSKNGSAKKS